MDLSKPIQQAFHYCPRCATEADPVGEVPFRCDQCGFAFFFGPVTAVGGILRDRSGQVLLIERARDPGKGKYGLPGGFVDHEESAEEALLREIHEEVGLRVGPCEYLTTLPNQYTYQGLTAAVLDIFFLVEVDSFASLVPNPHEVARCWLGVPGDDELANMAFHSNRLALMRYLQDRAKTTAQA